MLGTEIPHREGPPGGQAVGVQRDAQTFGHAAFVQRRYHALQIPLQQTHLLHMVEQAPADVGRRRRRRPNQYWLADPRLKQLDALGYRRLRKTKYLGGALEAGLFDHRGQRGKQLVVEHQFL